MDSVVVVVVTLDTAVDILGDDADEDEVTETGTAALGVSLRVEGAVVVAVLVDTVAVVEVVAVVIVLLSVVVVVVVTGRDVEGESEPAACFSLTVSSLVTVSEVSLPGNAELTIGVLLLPFVLLMLVLLLLLLFAVVVLLHILVAVVDVVIAVVDTAADGGDAVDVVSVLVTGAVATDAVVAVVVVAVVVALDITVLALILLALLLLILLLLLLLLVLFEDEFVVTLDAELFPIELFVEFAARSRPTVFCCCSRCSLVVTPVVNASTMHCV